MSTGCGVGASRRFDAEQAASEAVEAALLKRRVRELEELRAKSGGINLAGSLPGGAGSASADDPSNWVAGAVGATSASRSVRWTLNAATSSGSTSPARGVSPDARHTTSVVATARPAATPASGPPRGGASCTKCAGTGTARDGPTTTSGQSGGIPARQ